MRKGRFQSSESDYAGLCACVVGAPSNSVAGGGSIVTILFGGGRGEDLSGN